MKFSLILAILTFASSVYAQNVVTRATKPRVITSAESVKKPLGQSFTAKVPRAVPALKMSEVAQIESVTGGSALVEYVKEQQGDQVQSFFGINQVGQGVSVDSAKVERAKLATFGARELSKLQTQLSLSNQAAVYLGNPEELLTTLKEEDTVVSPETHIAMIQKLRAQLEENPQADVREAETDIVYGVAQKINPSVTKEEIAERLAGCAL